MKKMLANFGGTILARKEMSTIKGGTCCRVRSVHPNGGGSAGTYSMDQADADSLAASLNAGNDGYTYSVDCIEQ